MLKRRCPRKSAPTKKKLKLSQSTLAFDPISQPQVAPSVSADTQNIYPEIATKLKRYLKAYISHREDAHKPKGGQKSLMLVGPEGCGKSFLVRNSAKEMGLSLIEIGLGTSRTKSAIFHSIKEATQALNVNTKRSLGAVVFIDDVDINLPPDKGFYAAVCDLIENTKNPIIMTGTSVPSKIMHKKSINFVFMDECKYKICEFARGMIEEDRLRFLVDKSPNLHTVFSEARFASRDLPTNNDYCSSLDVESLALDVLVCTDFKPDRKNELNGKASKNYRTNTLCEFIEPKVEPFEEFCMGDLGDIVKEHLLWLGDPLNHIEMLQFLKGCANSLPSHILRKQGDSVSQLDLFLSKNPNQFK